MPNLNDVAKEAGVSKSTVSRILNNRLGNGFSVKEEVRLKVIDVAKTLNYRPNLIAKSLTMRSTQMIHIFGGNHALRDLGNIYQTVVNNITQVMDSASKDYDVTVDMSKHSPDSSEMPAWKIDGAIILAECTKSTMDEIRQLGVPYVVVNGDCPNDGWCVLPDDIGGTRIAIQHLVQLGHKRIAYSGPLPISQNNMNLNDRMKHAEYKDLGLEVDVLVTHRSLIDRYQTYISEMKKNGLEPIVNASDSTDNAEDYLRRMILDGVTAILAYGHMGALNILQAAHSLNIAVPERLSLMCFCDEYANRVMSPGLTFIDLCSEKMGRTAAELLLEQIRSNRGVKPRKLRLQEKLVLRNTTAPPSSL